MSIASGHLAMLWSRETMEQPSLKCATASVTSGGLHMHSVKTNLCSASYAEICVCQISNSLSFKIQVHIYSHFFFARPINSYPFHGSFQTYFLRLFQVLKQRGRYRTLHLTILPLPHPPPFPSLLSFISFPQRAQSSTPTPVPPDSEKEKLIFKTKIAIDIDKENWYSKSS